MSPIWSRHLSISTNVHSANMLILFFIEFELIYIQLWIINHKSLIEIAAETLYIRIHTQISEKSIQ